MGECVLVVDDDREIVKAISILLKGEGYEVLKAYDGLQALDILSTHPVKLVLIDVMMPKLDGLSALMRIREKQNIPIIVLSAKSEDSDKVLGLSMGADDYVAKPYNPQELAARVKSHLRRYTSLGDIHTRRGEDEIVNGRLSFKTDERVLYADGEDLPPQKQRLWSCLCGIWAECFRQRKFTGVCGRKRPLHQKKLSWFISGVFVKSWS